jgi:prephenate dehydrogenase
MTNLTIIGAGTMGQYTGRALAPKANLTYFDPYQSQEAIEEALGGMKFKFATNLETAVGNADVVVFCVPTDKVSSVMSEALPYCRSGTLISGQTSRKTPEAKSFDRYAKKNPSSGLEMVTIHTMANPALTDVSNEILGVIRHRASDRTYERALELYGDMSTHIEEFTDVEEHDMMTANTQINTSRTFLAIASSFARAGCFPWLEESYGSSLDMMKFSMAMRAASQRPHIYWNIWSGSRQGKEIVSGAIETENELYENIAGNMLPLYFHMAMQAREKIYGPNFGKAILDDLAMAQLSDNLNIKPNSHFSIISWFVSEAVSGRNPFGSLKATTPMHTSLLCMADYLFNNKALLEESLAAPFKDPKLKVEDLVYYTERLAWAQALLYGVKSLYESKHREMREVLEEKEYASRVKEHIDLSKKVVQICRERMSAAMESGLIAQRLQT